MKTMKEIKQEAKTKMSKCRACPVCNGLACRGEVPGPGGKDPGQADGSHRQAH